MWAACRCLGAAECLPDDGDSVAFASRDSPCDLAAFLSMQAVGPSTRVDRLVGPYGVLVDPSEDGFPDRDHCHSLAGAVLSPARSRLCVADAA
jgi:hypothetical protein